MARYSFSLALDGSKATVEDANALHDVCDGVQLPCSRDRRPPRRVGDRDSKELRRIVGTALVWGVDPGHVASVRKPCRTWPAVLLASVDLINDLGVGARPLDRAVGRAQLRAQLPCLTNRTACALSAGVYRRDDGLAAVPCNLMALILRSKFESLYETQGDSAGGELDGVADQVQDTGLHDCERPGRPDRIR